MNAIILRSAAKKFEEVEFRSRFSTQRLAQEPTMRFFHGSTFRGRTTAKFVDQLLVQVPDEQLRHAGLCYQ